MGQVYLNILNLKHPPPLIVHYSQITDKNMKKLGILHSIVAKMIENMR